MSKPVVYKVVRKAYIKGKKRLVSAFIDNAYEIIYERVKYNYPYIDKTKIFVFSSLTNAEEWANTMLSKMEIWECQFKGKPIEPPYISPNREFRTMHNIWAAYKSKKPAKEVFGTKAPEGTLWVDAIRLHKRIKVV